MKTFWRLWNIGRLEALRSPLWHKNVLVNVFMAFTFLYLAGNALLIGIVIDDLLMAVEVDGVTYSAYGPAWVAMRLHRFLLYAFAVDFVVRYFMQKMPLVSVGPYLHLPIQRKTLAHYILTKSLLSPFSALHAMLWLPFCFELIENLPFPLAAACIVGLWGTILFSHFAVLLVQRLSGKSVVTTVATLAVALLIVFLHTAELVDVLGLSSTLFNQWLLRPWSAAIPPVLAVGVYVLLFGQLKRHMQLSYTAATSHTYRASRAGTSLLWQMCMLEFKFIWRNKRPRSLLFMSVFFLLYGLFVFPNPDINSIDSLQTVIAVMVSGMFVMNYGQYLIGWEGSHFDNILTRNAPLSLVYKSKFTLFAIVTSACFVFSLPYAYFGAEVLASLAACFAFNLGVAPFFVMWLGSVSPKKIVLNQSTVFNMGGVGMAQFLLIIPTLGLPAFISMIGQLLPTPFGAQIALGTCGLLGLALAPIWLKWLGKWLSNHRHEIAADFRNQ